jgi:hypothetical protein
MKQKQRSPILPLYIGACFLGGIMLAPNFGQPDLLIGGIGGLVCGALWPGMIVSLLCHGGAAMTFAASVAFWILVAMLARRRRSAMAVAANRPSVFARVRTRTYDSWED